MLRIQDPVHGSIPVERAEIRLIDHPFFQRLRTIKQLGFADLAFPGATHTRYTHSLGAMHLATRVFDHLFPRGSLPQADHHRLRLTLRAALLFHDLGHPPLSHTSERLMPSRRRLGLPDWLEGDPDTHAVHEDYTLKILLDSALTAAIEQQLGDAGVTPAAIAALIAGRSPAGAADFRLGGIDYAPLLRQIVSGELDADRMDYLLRDSYFAGVSYGTFDLEWLLQNLTPIEREGMVSLGLDRRAVFSFEDFLLSRYHMFLTVYYHYAPVCFDQMLLNYFEEEQDCHQLPASADEYLEYDDLRLLYELRRSGNPWARRIVNRDGYRLLVEATDRDSIVPEEIAPQLAERGIDLFTCRSRGVLSKYFRTMPGESPLFVVGQPMDRHTPIQEYTPLYQRYAEAVHLVRLYCRPDQLHEARALLARVIA